MKTPRSTALAERLIVWLSVITLTWFVGYEVGRYIALLEAKPVCKDIKQQSLYQPRKVERRWINYWKAQL